MEKELANIQWHKHYRLKPRRHSYCMLTNASQTTYGPEATFEIKDETDPTVTVTAQGSPSTNSITVTAQARMKVEWWQVQHTHSNIGKWPGSYTTPSGAAIFQMQHTHLQD